ncbi:MAG: hypothetical protein OCD02_13825 [Spirochaetaceae bacterium]
MVEVYKGFGIELDEYNGEGQLDLPFAATLIVDTEGTVAYSYVDTDYTVRAEPTEVLRELKALVE